MRKIGVVTGTRADYGILKPVIEKIKKNPGLELSIFAAGMHLSHEHGYTVNEITRDGNEIAAKIDMLLSDDSPSRMAKSIGIGILQFSQAFEIVKPDILVVLGDREEPFAAALAGLGQDIPIAHISGGEVATGGHIDESLRHALTKMAHIHFATSSISAQRIGRLGEEQSRIFHVGSSSLDSILHMPRLTDDQISKKYELDMGKPIILVLEHPLTIRAEDSANLFRHTLESIKQVGEQTVLIYPNADAGGKKMIELIKQYEHLPFIRTYKNLPFEEYLSLMDKASVMVGNSSSGIIEAPTFRLPVVNVGPRQDGRERAANVIDVDYDTVQIKNAILKAINDQYFRKIVQNCQSPYGDGTASVKMVDILATIDINERLIHKKITY